MHPPPGFEPSISSLLENATPTSILSAAIGTASSILPIGVDMPSPTTLAAVAVATAMALSDIEFQSHDDDEPPKGECRLLGSFAILVQGALGCLALLALVYKRWRERPQRPMKIWFFDVSKQVVGSVLVHIANLVMSMLSSGQFSMKLDAASVVTRRMVDENGKYTPNPCSFYLLNLAIDTTIGIPILIFLLRIFTRLFAMTPFGNPRESIESGNYGSPPRAWWWVKQSLIYFMGLMGMKFCVLIIFLVLPWISRIGDWALRWTEGDEVLQVIFVMLVFPVIMNATQYYIIDSFIKKQSHEQEHERIPDEDTDSESGDSAYDNSDRRRSNSIHEADPEVLAKEDQGRKDSSPTKPPGGSGGKKPRKLQTGSKDYDPQYDGESSPVIGSSSSTSERDRLVQTEQGSGDDTNKSKV